MNVVDPFLGVGLCLARDNCSVCYGLPDVGEDRERSDVWRFECHLHGENECVGVCLVSCVVLFRPEICLPPKR